MLFLGIINVVEQKYFFLIFWLFEYTAEVSFSGVEKAAHYAGNQATAPSPVK